jgi:hypothetical protein
MGAGGGVYDPSKQDSTPILKTKFVIIKFNNNI